MAKRRKPHKGSSRRRNDPHFEREARRYENPIPSREFIIETLEAEGQPLQFREVAGLLGLGEEQLEALRRRLGAMERDGQVIRNRRDGYCVVNRQDLVAGRVIGHADGFGFLVPDEGGEDLFLPAREMRSLMHGDRAVVQVAGIDRRGRREGALVEVLERNFHQVVGRVFFEEGLGRLEPDHKRLSEDILIPDSYRGEARDGQMVMVEITSYPTRRKSAIGRVVEILGDHRARGMETDVAIRSHEIPAEWPEAVVAQVRDFSEKVKEAEKAGRVDLRHVPLVTIDGEDARDFDDAVYCQRTNKGWKLLVAIADVSAYVTQGDDLDLEAVNRGNSVYFPDRVVPMLPEVLSNGLCSLNPAVDRLCMVCEIGVDADGRLARSRFYEAVMHSHARLTYTKVAAILDGDKKLNKKYRPLVPHLQELHALFEVLLKGRKARGAIDFDTVETRIRFDDAGKIDAIVPVHRNVAHRIIEECMLMANVATARFLERRRIPGLYRIHEGPTAEKLSDLREFLGELGLHLEGGDKPEAGHYANLLDGIQQRPDAHLIQTVLLRSLSQAIYCTTNMGHFGLAYPAYAHFTSPIRRYPDLLVHRAIKHALAKGKAEDFGYTPAELKGLAEHCSATERRADEATRDAMDTLKCEFMLDRVGESFPGIISGVTGFGLFVELDDIYVDGLVHITALERDYYHFDPVHHRLVGERGGRVFRLGDTLKILVAAVNLDERKIDFVLAEGEEGAGHKKKSRKGGDADRRVQRRTSKRKRR